MLPNICSRFRQPHFAGRINVPQPQFTPSGFWRKVVYLVEDNRHGATYLVFTWEDPRKAGCKGRVVEDVTLDYDMEAVHSWPDGQAMPEACVGRAPDHSKHYKVFKYSRELTSEGYEPVVGNPVVFGSWKEYVEIHLIPPDPEQTDDQLWYDYLDKLDEDSRRRRRNPQVIAMPSNGNRDEVAAWVAKKHFVTDSAVREIWYLPQSAPPEEIRLLEVSDRLAGPESEVEAIDFGLDIEGARFRLLIADITSEVLDQIKQNPSRLPSGWSLDDNKIWKRRRA